VLPTSQSLAGVRRRRGAGAGCVDADADRGPDLDADADADPDFGFDFDGRSRGTLGIKAFTFDGDTPGDARKAVRTRGDIVLSNPDMLHQAILPHHTKWAQFFESLAFVVVDELHGYRGVFGSHVANVFRRLLRVCRFYGARPIFIFASATIANPAELAARLIGAPVSAVTDSGAPRGERHLLLWNPPVIDPDLGIRASARSQTTRIARAATKQGLKNIVFARSRLMVEVITKYLKDVFDRDPRRPPRVLAYRGGYLPSERRAGEQALRAGRVDCVVSTSALELGVDIGALGCGGAERLSGHHCRHLAAARDGPGGAIGPASACSSPPATRWISTWCGTRSSFSAARRSTRASIRTSS
jgi:ATP-dependent helicase YprA (DUF1998 family)